MTSSQLESRLIVVGEFASHRFSYLAGLDGCRAFYSNGGRLWRRIGRLVSSEDEMLYLMRWTLWMLSINIKVEYIIKALWNHPLNDRAEIKLRIAAIVLSQK